MRPRASRRRAWRRRRTETAAGRQGKGCLCCPPAKDKAAGETCLGALQGAPGAPCSQWHPPSGSIPRLAGNVGEGPFGRPRHSRGEGAMGLHPGLAIPCSRCPIPAAAMRRACGVPGCPPSSSIGWSQPGLMPLTPTWGWDPAWGGSGGHGSPPRSASSLSHVFVCPVPYLPTGLLCPRRLGGARSASAGPPAPCPLLLLAVSELCPAGSPCLGCPATRWQGGAGGW